MICKIYDTKDSQMLLKSFQNLNALRLEVVLGNCEGDASYFDDLCNFLVNCPVSKMNISVRFHSIYSH